MTDRAPTLLADVGGTHVRFALRDAGGALLRREVMATSGCASFAEAMCRWLADGDDGWPADAAICAAGPIEGGAITLTNRDWVISATAVADAGIARVLLVNDFSAMAAAAPFLEHHELRRIGDCERAPRAPMAVIGPGTGLGVSAAIAGPNGVWEVLSGEGGHVSLAAGDEFEGAVIASLRQRFGHVSAERALSGDGLRNLYRAIAEVEGDGAGGVKEPPAASAIAERAHLHRESRARRAVALFTDWLGAVAGDLALTFGARGGVFVAGGMVPAWGTHFDSARFRRRFEAKGRFGDWLRAVPCHLVVAPHPAFTGLGALLDARARAGSCARAGSGW